MSRDAHCSVCLSMCLYFSLISNNRRNYVFYIWSKKNPIRTGECLGSLIKVLNKCAGHLIGLVITHLHFNNKCNSTPNSVVAKNAETSSTSKGDPLVKQ